MTATQPSRLLLYTTLAMSFSARVLCADEPIDVGSNRQLFVDKLLIDELQGVQLRLHHPVRREVVMALDKPWDGNLAGYVRVFRDGDAYRMYYRGRHWPGIHEALAAGKPGKTKTKNSTHWSTNYAVSKNGIHWIRPGLGLVDFAGSKKNNILFSAPEPVNASVFKDTNPQCPADERYKMVGRGTGGGHPLGTSPKEGIYMMVSADGIKWRKADPYLVAAVYLDGGVSGFWDYNMNRYVIYGRGNHPAKGRFRAINYTTSPDGKNWAPVKFIDVQGGLQHHFYNSCGNLYYRGPYYLLFPSRHVQYRKPELFDIVFLSSRDGENFTQLSREGLIRPGLYPENWAGKALFSGSNLVQTGPGEMSLYVTTPSPQTRNLNHVIRYSLREDGLVSVNAPAGGGSLTTGVFTFDGDRLDINYSTSAIGSIRVGLLTPDGEAVKGFSVSDCEEIYGDQITHVVKWKNSPNASTLSGKPVRLTFAMKDADLYSFRFFRENRQEKE